jgi:hypothetical protein
MEADASVGGVAPALTVVRGVVQTAGMLFGEALLDGLEPEV